MKISNADKFKKLFGIYATELWSMPEAEFLKWLNAEVEEDSPKEYEVIAGMRSGKTFLMNRYIADKCKNCGNCLHNYSKRYMKQKYGEDYNHEDLVCNYWESDGLTDKDFCSQWKDEGEDDGTEEICEI